MRVLRLLGATAVASAVVSMLTVMPAEAASWAGQSNNGATFETCTKARTSNRVAYTTCIQYASAHTKVRVVIRVQTTAQRSVAGTSYLKVPGQSNNLSTRSCSGTLASGAKKQCATGWLNANRIVQVGEGSVKVGSSTRPAMRVRGMRLKAKKQENSAKYCGPAAVQAALWTLKGSAPSQDTLANSSNLQTNRYGFTSPYKLAGVLNKYRSAAQRDADAESAGDQPVGEATAVTFADEAEPAEAQPTDETVVTPVGKEQPVVGQAEQETEAAPDEEPSVAEGEEAEVTPVEAESGTEEPTADAETAVEPDAGADLEASVLASNYALYDFGPVGQSVELAYRQLYRSIDAGNPVVYLVDPSRLPWSSNPAGTSVRHYILLHGYSAYKTNTDTNLNGGWIAERFSAWDPADGKRHNISAIDLQNASNGSEYIDDDMVFAAK